MSLCNKPYPPCHMPLPPEMEAGYMIMQSKSEEMSNGIASEEFTRFKLWLQISVLLGKNATDMNNTQSSHAHGKKYGLALKLTSLV